MYFGGYIIESKGYCLYHPEARQEDAVQPCFHILRSHLVTPNIFMTLCGLFSVTPTRMLQFLLITRFQMMMLIILFLMLICKKKIEKEQTDTREAKTMLKWLMQTWQDSKLDACLPSHIC